MIPLLAEDGAIANDLFKWIAGGEAVAIMALSTFIAFLVKQLIALSTAAAVSQSTTTNAVAAMAEKLEANTTAVNNVALVVTKCAR